MLYLSFVVYSDLNIIKQLKKCIFQKYLKLIFIHLIAFIQEMVQTLFKVFSI